ncbi:MAG: carbohydrate ABC transporter permease, partial [Chloroflexi bacterium]|nr:carbohydrate ABC transporter permease [Chloroflexota bacterium]
MATVTRPMESVSPKRRAKTDWSRILVYAVLISGALISVLPFVYMLMTSFKSLGSVITNNFWPWWPFGNEPLEFQNYGDAIRDAGIDRQWNVPLVFRYFANSLIVSLVTIVGVLITSVLSAYALTHIDLPGKNILFIAILATIMIPNDLTLVPKVVMMFNLGWYNTYL